MTVRIRRVGPVSFGHCVIMLRGRALPWFCLFGSKTSDKQ